MANKPSDYYRYSRRMRISTLSLPTPSSSSQSGSSHSGGSHSGGSDSGSHDSRSRASINTITTQNSVQSNVNTNKSNANDSNENESNENESNQNDIKMETTEKFEQIYYTNPKGDDKSFSVLIPEVKLSAGDLVRTYEKHYVDCPIFYEKVNLFCFLLS